MTKWILRLAFLFLLALCAVWVWHALFPGPELVIRKRLQQLAGIASTSGTEGNLARMNNARKLTTFFTPDLEISIEVLGQYETNIRGVDELLRLAVAARSMGQPIKVDLVDVNVIVAPDKQSAEAHMTGSANLRGEKMPQVQELKAQLKKVDGQWLISRAETVRTLR
jgi:hypothetical protein